MSIPTLGRLEDCSLREAWTNEASNFTPWLAENLDALGAAIGMSLEFEAREVPVESFSADILARNLADETRVLIENQLEDTDHRHLGQIMTYLAGLDVRTVIWVAKAFNPAHMSAIKWLNANTTQDFGFFAVRVRVVRIGDSALAPVFEVLERPNQFERKLQAAAREAGALSESGKLRQSFWEAYLARYPQDEALGFSAKAAASNWAPLDSDLVVATYFGAQESGVFVRGARGADAEIASTRLAPHAATLEARLGAPMGKGTKYLFTSSRRGDWTDPSSWPTLGDWLHERIHAYRAVLKDVLGLEG